MRAKMHSIATIACAGMALTVAVRLLQPQHDAVGSPSLRLQSMYDHNRQLTQFRAPSSNNYGWNFTDTRTVKSKGHATSPTTHVLEPIQICDRKAALPHEVDMKFLKKYAQCRISKRPPGETRIFLLDGLQTFGRMGNNMLSFLHALQYAKDKNKLLAIMEGSWPMHLITDMFMSIQDNDIKSWETFFEETFCLKIIHNMKETEKYLETIPLEYNQGLFIRKWPGYDLDVYMEYQTYILRTFWRFYNTGKGVTISRSDARNMCSVVDNVLGDRKQSAEYSVIHSRSMESNGIKHLERVARRSGCDPVAALEMEPEYVKAILTETSMLDKPIIFITDNQRPEILEKLLADPDIGPNLLLKPEEVGNWAGGDITAAVLANVFIGNPASTFSGFIAKSRVALGYTNNYLLRKKKEDGKWGDVCGRDQNRQWIEEYSDRCIFDKSVMNILA